MNGSDNAFTLVGPGRMRCSSEQAAPSLRQRLRGKPVAATAILAIIIFGCVFAGMVASHDPTQLFLDHVNEPPGAVFYFGTDSLGRDIYSNIWHGGRASLLIGLASAAIATLSGVLYGCLSGMASDTMDAALMRAVELVQSVPTLLTVLLLVAMTGRQNAVTLSAIIGLTGWFGLARIVRGEVRQIRHSEYILASRHMGAGFGYLVRRHLAPNFVAAILFIVISSVATGMALEATLSYLGLGLPVDVLSWGSMLSLADRAILLNTWWVVAAPGIFLVLTLLCINSVGQYFRRQNTRRPSNM